MKTFFQSYKYPVSVTLLMMLAAGIFSYTKMKTALFPEITFPKIKVIADAGQQPVDRMMIDVTRPLENAIKQVQDLKVLRSTTSRGSCEISAFMDWKSDVDLDLQRIEARINQAQSLLPPNINITVEKMNPSILPVMGYTLQSHSRSQIELKQIAIYTVKPFLSQVDGVSEVRIIGGKTKEYWLELNTQKMSSLGITPDVISTALQQTNFIQSNGYLDDYRFLYLTLTDAAIDHLDELKDAVIRNDGKRVVRLEDIAEVKIHEAKEYVRINANGKDAILVAVIKQPDANLIEMSAAMVKKVTELQQLLPKDVTLQPYYAQSEFVNDSIKSVRDNLLLGLILAIIVAVLFLRSLRASITILCTIPVTLCITIVVLYAAGFTLNIMTLGAMAAAIGLIIDDAIVVVEQIHRTREEHPDETSSVVVHRALRYLMPAIIGSSLSTIVIFFPFILLSGVAGAYFKVMTDTMIITLGCSFLSSWIALPVIYLLLSGKNHSSKKNEKREVVKSQRWLSFFLRKPWISILFMATLIIVGAFVMPKLKTGFLPEMDEGSIVIDYASPPGTSLYETDRMLREVEKIITAIPEVETYSRRTGTEMGFFITEPNTGDYLIQLKKDRSRTSDEVADDIRKQVESTQPALRIEFGQVIRDMLGDLIATVQPVEVKIFGDNQKQLQELSQQVAGVIKSVSGTADIFDGIVIAGPSISVQPDEAMCAQYGITPANLQYQLQTALEGTTAGKLYENEKTADIRMVYPGNITLSVTQLRHLQVFLPKGMLKPIEQLALIDVHHGDAQIQRENLQSMGVVTARLNQRDLGSVMNDIQRKISAQIHLPSGYHLQYGGAYAQQQQSFQELLIILIMASLLVFGVILFLYRDFKIAFLILIIAIFGIAGSCLALFITHTTLNVGSYTGIIMIVGIIGENAIFTILQFNESRQTKSVDDAILYAISTRLRPKLMTAFGAIIALLPIAVGIGTGAQLHQPLAIAVIGGFVIALPLLLIVLPSLLRLIFIRGERNIVQDPEH